MKPTRLTKLDDQRLGSPGSTSIQACHLKYVHTYLGHSLSVLGPSAMPAVLLQVGVASDENL
jgi:hypothetical protein